MSVIPTQTHDACMTVTSQLTLGQPVKDAVLAKADFLFYDEFLKTTPFVVQRCLHKGTRAKMLVDNLNNTDIIFGNDGLFNCKFARMEEKKAFFKYVNYSTYFVTHCNCHYFLFIL